MNPIRPQAIALPRGGENSALATNSVIRNTYLLLSLTLAFAAVSASVSVALKLPHPGILLTLGGFFGLLYAVHKLKNSGWGILAVFALTGFMGYTLGPIISRYLGLPNGAEIVMQAMGGTAVTNVLAIARGARPSREDALVVPMHLRIGGSTGQRRRKRVSPALGTTNVSGSAAKASTSTVDGSR